MDPMLSELYLQISHSWKNIRFVDIYTKFKDRDRIKFALHSMLKYNIYPQARGIQKNANGSEKLLKEGDTLFSKVPLDDITCHKVLELYTKSIAFAPYSSEQLAIAYGNRSEVLFRLGLNLECIQDIDRALVLNYPDHLKAKIHIRRAECSIILGKNSVKDDIKEAQYWLEMMSFNDANTKKLQKELHTLCDKINIVAQVEPEETQIDILPTIIESHSNEIPCASDAITVKYNERYGRHVVATRDIRPGELLAVERPYSLMIWPKERYTHCSHCLKLCFSNIPCNYCVYVMYCSEECKDIAWRKYHDVECAVFSALIEYGFNMLHLFCLKLAILAVREAGSIRELKTILEEIDKCDDPRTKGFSQDGKLYSDKYISLYYLQTNTEERIVPNLLKKSLDACIILYFLATQTMFFGTKLPEDIGALMENNDATFFAGLILRHLQIFPRNMRNFNETCDLSNINRGMAAMPFLNLLNHSCNPNVLVFSRSEDIALYAIYPIKKDEQILESYGPYYGMDPKALRQQKLFEAYNFTCDCIACREDWPYYSQLESFENLVKNANNKVKIRKALKKLDIYVKLALRDTILNKPDTVKNVLEMIQVLHDNVLMPCREMSKAVEIVKRIQRLTINIKIPKLRL